MSIPDQECESWESPVEVCVLHQCVTLGRQNWRLLAYGRSRRPALAARPPIVGVGVNFFFFSFFLDFSFEHNLF